MDENREFLRLIIMEGLGGDEAALEQYDRLLDLWENALTTVLRRYEEKGELPGNSAETVARHIIYTILMAFEESLLGRHVPPSASTRTDAPRSDPSYAGPGQHRGPEPGFVTDPRRPV